MACCSVHCDRYLICSRAYESGSTTNWCDYSSGGSNSETTNYCGPRGSYKMFQPADFRDLENLISLYKSKFDKLNVLIEQGGYNHEN